MPFVVPNSLTSDGKPDLTNIQRKGKCTNCHHEEYNPLFSNTKLVVTRKGYVYKNNLLQNVICETGFIE